VSYDINIEEGRTVTNFNFYW